MPNTLQPEVKYRTAQPDPGKPTVLYLHTGGTLMMVPSKKDSGALSFEGAVDIPQVMQVLNDLANLEQHVNVIGVFLDNIDSKEVDSRLWTALANTVEAFYDEVDGVVVGHGTHTLEYSAAALGFALRGLAIPVVFTASQIPILGHLGSDGLPNLTGAFQVAAFSEAAEVLVYAHGEIHRGVRVTKANDSRLGVFDSPVTGPVGYFTASGVELMPGVRLRSEVSKDQLQVLPRFSAFVTALKLQPGMDHRLVDLICEHDGNRGLVIETYGSGAIPQKMVPVLARQIGRGFPVYLSSSCAESGASGGMQGHDEDARAAYAAGVRNVGDMSTSTATVKLMHVLGNNPDATLQQVEVEMTQKSYAGELSV